VKAVCVALLLVGNSCFFFGISGFRVSNFSPRGWGVQVSPAGESLFFVLQQRKVTQRKCTPVPQAIALRAMASLVTWRFCGSARRDLLSRRASAGHPWPADHAKSPLHSAATMGPQGQKQLQLQLQLQLQKAKIKGEPNWLTILD
jgi:hypothetical protein